MIDGRVSPLSRDFAATTAPVQVITIAMLLQPWTVAVVIAAPTRGKTSSGCKPDIAGR